jgi:hypothetical protein
MPVMFGGDRFKQFPKRDPDGVPHRQQKGGAVGPEFGPLDLQQKIFRNPSWVKNIQT